MLFVLLRIRKLYACKHLFLQVSSVKLFIFCKTGSLLHVKRKRLVFAYIHVAIERSRLSVLRKDAKLECLSMLGLSVRRGYFVYGGWYILQ